MARPDIAHLLRRATFGPTAEEVDAAEKAGFDATLDALIAPKSADAGAARTPIPMAAAGQNRDDQERNVIYWWLDRMVQAEQQLTEKMIFFWHGHWATSVEKVGYVKLMQNQLETFRTLGRGDFAELVKKMVRDPALIYWLDNQLNTKKAPNENLARELMELFTLGIGNYTEDDIKEGARALTGWQVNRESGNVTFVPGRYDSGAKTILGSSANFDADGFVGVLMGRSANAQFLARRLWFRFVSGETLPSDVEQRLTSAYRPARNIDALLRAVFKDPAFLNQRGKLVKQPVEWAVGAMRQLGIRPGALSNDQRRTLYNGLDALDQIPLRPPGVGGWPTGAAWLTTSSVQQRLKLSDTLAGWAAAAATAKLSAAPVDGRVDALGRLLVVDSWTSRTRAALTPEAGNIKRLLTLGLASPEYSVH